MAAFNLSEMQKEYWRNCNHRWNIKTGATGSGKTYLDFYLIPDSCLQWIRIDCVAWKHQVNFTKKYH